MATKFVFIAGTTTRSRVLIPVRKPSFFPQTIYSSKTSGELDDVVRRFRPDVAFVHNIYPLISPSAYHTLHALRVPSVQVLHNFRPFCINGLFYIQDKVCEKCKGGNYLHAVKNRCYKDSYALSGLYAFTMASNRMAGMVDKISGFICLTEFFKIKMREAGVPENKLSSGLILCDRLSCRRALNRAAVTRSLWVVCLLRRDAGR